MRPATVDDLPRLLEMGRKFHAQSGMAFGFDDSAVSELLTALIANGCVLMTERGVIGGMLNPAYCDPAWVMAVELFWWAEGDGLLLLKGFEEWAESVGASEVRMTSLASLPRADAILRRKGYAPAEISYQKVI